jgi:type IV pilus assembly protein PilM
LGADARGVAESVAQARPGDNSIAAIAARLAAAGSQAPVSASAATSEVAQAVSVAAAYFEDTLETAPAVVLAAGTLGADALTEVLDAAEVGPVAVQEVVSSEMLGAGATSAGTPGGVPLGWLAGVRGALAN